MDKGSHLVSVIIPLYNSENYIRETITSVINQTYPHIEIIIIDDGSTDNSYAIGQEFSSGNCKVIRQENKGACAARNHGIEESSGEYLQFLDADDVLSLDKIKVQMDVLLENDPNTIATGAWYYFEKRITEYRDHSPGIFKSYDDPVDLLQDMWSNQEFMASTVYLFHRSLLDRSGIWDESLTINQDGEFFCRLLLAADKVKYCQCTCYYRTGIPGTVSKGHYNYKNAKSRLRSYRLYEKNTVSRSDETLRRALSVNYYYFIYIYYETFPELVKEAIARTKALGYPPPSEIGGANFQKLLKIFGFFNVLWMRSKLKNSSNPKALN